MTKSVFSPNPHHKPQSLVFNELTRRAVASTQRLGIFTTERTEAAFADTEVVGERDLQDSQTANAPLLSATDLSSFRRRPLIGPLMAMELPAAKTSNRSRGAFENRVSVSAKRFPCIPWLKKPLPTSPTMVKFIW